MSVHVSSRVWQLRGIPPTHKLVLLKLADCANDEGENAYPAVATIAAECGCSDRTATRALGDLVRWGYLSVQKPATRYHPTTYRVTPDDGIRGANLAPLDESRGDSLTPLDEGRGDICDTPGVTSATGRGDTHVTRSVSDPSVDPSDPDLARARGEPEGVRVAFEGLKAAGIEVTALVAEAVVERVDGGTPGEWIREAARKTALAGARHWNYVARVLDGWGKDGPPEPRKPGGRNGRRDEAAWGVDELDPDGELRRNGVLSG